MGPAATQQQDTGQECNIWYHKKVGKRSAAGKQVAAHAEHRCNPEIDSGSTRGSEAGASFCCLHFARGECHLGYACDYLHRLPTAADNARLACDNVHDIFGRQKDLDSAGFDLKGSGSCSTDSRTLYVYYGGAGHLGQQIKPVLEANFATWGPVERVHIVPAKMIAFIHYRMRASAEFAKEAMHGQSLQGSDLNEVLDVRWANEDPNPRAVKRTARDREEEYMHAVRHAVMELPPEQKRARLMELQMPRRVGGVVSAYPDTDHAYEVAAGEAAGDDEQTTDMPSHHELLALHGLPPSSASTADGCDGDGRASGGAQQCHHHDGDAAQAGGSHDGNYSLQQWYIGRDGSWYPAHEGREITLPSGTSNGDAVTDASYHEWDPDCHSRAAQLGVAYVSESHAPAASDSVPQNESSLALLTEYGTDDDGT